MQLFLISCTIQRLLVDWSYIGIPSSLSLDFRNKNKSIMSTYVTKKKYFLEKKEIRNARHFIGCMTFTMNGACVHKKTERHLSWSSKCASRVSLNGNPQVREVLLMSHL